MEMIVDYLAASAAEQFPRIGYTFLVVVCWWSRLLFLFDEEFPVADYLMRRVSSYDNYEDICLLKG